MCPLISQSRRMVSVSSPCLAQTNMKQLEGLQTMRCIDGPKLGVLFYVTCWERECIPSVDDQWMH